MVTVALVVGLSYLQTLYKNPGQLALSRTLEPGDTDRFCFSHTFENDFEEKA